MHGDHALLAPLAKDAERPRVVPMRRGNVLEQQANRFRLAQARVVEQRPRRVVLDVQGQGHDAVAMLWRQGPREPLVRLRAWELGHQLRGPQPTPHAPLAEFASRRAIDRRTRHLVAAPLSMYEVL